MRETKTNRPQGKNNASFSCAVHTGGVLSMCKNKLFVWVAQRGRPSEGGIHH